MNLPASTRFANEVVGSLVTTSTKWSPALGLGDNLLKQRRHQFERLDNRQPRTVQDREVRRQHEVSGQRHLLESDVRAQPHRRVGEPDHYVLVPVGTDPVTHSGHRAVKCSG